MGAVALSGFMACGKSYFGRRVAEALGWRFIDLDKEISEAFGTPESIFRRCGETGFRKAEEDTLSRVLEGLVAGENVLLALGGGTVLSQNNIAILRRHKVKTVWLDTSFEIILSEIGNSRRPLAEGKSEAELKALLEARRPAYEASADYVFNVDSFDYDGVTSRLESFMKNVSMKKVTVFLGSRPGNDPKFCATAREFGRRLAEENMSIVYGGSSVGTMEALAGGCIDAGGSCIGVFPKGFGGKPEVAATGRDIQMKGLSEMYFTDDFAERKKMMNELGDCCVALPGSWGTLDELFTYATDTELKFNGGKPIFVLNLDGYFEPIKKMISTMYENGFILEYSTKLITFCDSLDELMRALKSF